MRDTLLWTTMTCQYFVFNILWLCLRTHTIFAFTRAGQNKMFTTEKNEPSRAHVNAPRVLLTNQIPESSLFCLSFSSTQMSGSLMWKNCTENRLGWGFYFKPSFTAFGPAPSSVEVLVPLPTCGCYGCEFVRGCPRGKWRVWLLLGHVTEAALICFDKQWGGKWGGQADRKHHD